MEEWPCGPTSGPWRCTRGAVGPRPWSTSSLPPPLQKNDSRGQGGSNPRPDARKGGALPLELSTLCVPDVHVFPFVGIKSYFGIFFIDGPDGPCTRSCIRPWLLGDHTSVTSDRDDVRRAQQRRRPWDRAAATPAIVGWVEEHLVAAAPVGQSRSGRRLCASRGAPISGATPGTELRRREWHEYSTRFDFF